MESLVRIPTPPKPKLVQPEASTAPRPVPAPPRQSLADAQLRSELDLLRRQLSLVKDVLGVPSIDASVLQEKAEEAAQGAALKQRIERFQTQLEIRETREALLEERLSALQDSFDDAQIDLRESTDSLSRIRDENRYLKQQLTESGDFESAFGGVPSDAYTLYPENFDALLTRCKELEDSGVRFTGVEAETRALDEHDTLGNAVHAAWDGLLALADYLRARRAGDCDAGVRAYLRETPAGFRSMPSNKFGGKETKATMKRWGNERQFPVPPSVAPGGLATMEAHFKLAPIGMVSPRMYFLDCFSTTGQVYVGYIGAHLTNTMT